MQFKEKTRFDFFLREMEKKNGGMEKDSKDESVTPFQRWWKLLL